MSSYRLGRYLLPVTLGALGLLLLVRILLLETSVLTLANADVVALVALLAVAIVAAIHTMVRISMNYLRLLSIERARRETLAEHGRFLRRLDHELKNPLTALRAGLKTLSLTPLDERQQQIVTTLETETLRLNQLVADLRKLAELETQPLNLRPVDLGAFAENIVQVEQGRFEVAQRVFSYRQDLTRLVWVVDEDLLALAVHNLLDNAFKYTKPGDAIRLEMATQQDLMIRVTDEGMGIPDEALPYIWEELYRADPVAKIPGSGIGLALVKAIVDRHSGTIQVQSTHGATTAVTLRIPHLAELTQAVTKPG